MGYVSTITSKGQVTVPADVRRHLGAREGTKLVFDITPEGGVSLRVVRPGLAGLRGIVRPRIPVSGALIDQWAREARDHGFREEPEDE
jgi:AbrB family looped-hinge helix DNA binding protein